MENNENNEIDLLHWQNKFYQRLKEQKKSPNTIKNYRVDLSVFNKYLNFRNQSTNIANFSEQSALDFGQYLEDKYPSANSRRRRLQAVRIFFDFLMEKNEMNMNPLRKIKTSPKELDGPDPLNLPEVIKIHTYLQEQIKQNSGLERLINQRNLVIFYLIYYHAPKVSDLERAQLTHLTHNPNKDELRFLITPRTRDPYTVAGPSHWWPIFESYKRNLKKELKGHDLKSENNQGLLFNANAYSILSNSLSARGIEVVFNRISKAVGIEFTAKRLRQTAIIKWHSDEIKLARIKEWMGVAPSYSIKTYTEFYENHKNTFVYKDLNQC